MASGTQRLVTGYECDVPMALSKGIIGKKRTNLPRCKKQCSKCVAALKIQDDGTKVHT